MSTRPKVTVRPRDPRTEPERGPNIPILDIA
jgi:hypothetical protein